MKNDKPRFLLDIDGVCANFLLAALAAVLKVTGKQYKPEDFPTWDIFDIISREHEPACYELFRAHGFCADIEPYPGAAEGVQQLRSITDLHVVTSPIHGPHWYFERAEWVRRHLHVPPGDVIQTRHKQFVVGDFLLDDRPKHVEDWAMHHPNGIALLWDQPYNRGEDGMLKGAPGNGRRVHSWDEVIEAVRSSELHFPPVRVF